MGDAVVKIGDWVGSLKDMIIVFKPSLTKTGGLVKANGSQSKKFFGIQPLQYDVMALPVELQRQIVEHITKDLEEYLKWCGCKDVHELDENGNCKWCHLPKSHESK